MESRAAMVNARPAARCPRLADNAPLTSPR